MDSRYPDQTSTRIVVYDTIESAVGKWTPYWDDDYRVLYRQYVKGFRRISYLGNIELTPLGCRKRGYTRPKERWKKVPKKEWRPIAQKSYDERRTDEIESLLGAP